MVREIAIVSLSSGTIGEPFVQHEVAIGLRRLEEYGLRVTFMPHALRGLDYVRQHPEDRAADLLEAFRNPKFDMILCAIGGDDTYRLLPYLFERDALKNALRKTIFLGFSDTTVNHFMLHKLGLPTFYGQSFLADVCELESSMLPYSAGYFEELLKTGTIRKIVPSDVWFEERKDFSENAVGTSRISHANSGFIRLQGSSRFHGSILGGCLESIYDMLDNSRYPDTVSLCAKYGLFPEPEEWKDKILLLETSEEQPAPEHYREMLLALKATGVFSEISGILCGKPMDERYDGEYRKILLEAVDNPELPIVWNINVGHATPRCIIPLGVEAQVDADLQQILFPNSL